MAISNSNLNNQIKQNLFKLCQIKLLSILTLVRMLKIKYIQKYKEDDFIYSFHAVIHPEVPLNIKYVRLIHAAGEWRLSPLDSTKTEITYTWNGELLGDFPEQVWGGVC